MVIHYAVLQDVAAWADAFAPIEMIIREQYLGLHWHDVIFTKVNSLLALQLQHIVFALAQRQSENLAGLAIDACGH